MASTDSMKGLLNQPRGTTEAKYRTRGRPAWASDLNRKLNMRYVTNRGPMVMTPARMLPCTLRTDLAKTDFTVLSPI
jgi:hypothetical protein